MKLIINLLILFSLMLLNTNHLQGRQLKKITIIYTNSLNGNFDFCKCKEDPKGGLVKRATEIKKLREQFKNILLFETGDFFTYEPDQLLSKYLIKSYKYINYDAIVFGDQELVNGIDYFFKFKKELPFICNNIMFKNNNWVRFPKSYILLNKNNIKIGIIGTIYKESFKYYPKKLLSKIKILDQLKEIKNDIKALKGMGAELIILLSHSGFDRDMEIQEKTDVNIIIGGHSQTLIKQPSIKNNSIIVQAGSNGAHIGILEIEFANGKINSFKNSFRRPDEYQPGDDKYIRELINEYHRELKDEINKLRFKK